MDGYATAMDANPHCTEMEVVKENRPIVADDPFVQVKVELSPTHGILVKHEFQFQLELNLGQVAQILGV